VSPRNKSVRDKNNDVIKIQTFHLKYSSHEGGTPGCVACTVLGR